MKKNRIVCLIDGFNFYHSINSHFESGEFKWMDLKNLVSQYLFEHEILSDIYYFSALCNWNQEKQLRHKRYIKALKSTGVIVELGKFKKKRVKCKECLKNYYTREEKRTDVNIAIRLLELAYEDKFDTALLMTGDTDLAPAIDMVKAKFPEKKIGMLFPLGRVNNELKRCADFSRNINEDMLQLSRFPNEIEISPGKVLTCPEEWL